jgi:hypothetical protein
MIVLADYLTTLLCPVSVSSFPCIFRITPGSSSLVSLESISVAAAVGSDTSVGAHIEQIATHFERSSRSALCRARLEDHGILGDESNEVIESLLEASKR